MDQAVSDKKSYHIVKDFGGDNYFHWWPMSAWGIYCDDIEVAKEEFKKLVEENGKESYKLFSYDAVVKNNVIIGIVHGTKKNIMSHVGS